MSSLQNFPAGTTTPTPPWYCFWSSLPSSDEGPFLFSTVSSLSLSSKIPCLWLASFCFLLFQASSLQPHLPHRTVPVLLTHPSQYHTTRESGVSHTPFQLLMGTCTTPILLTDTPINEDVVDKIRAYRADCNNRPSNSISFLSVVTTPLVSFTVSLCVFCFFSLIGKQTFFYVSGADHA